MTECPSAAWERHYANEEAKAEGEAALDECKSTLCSLYEIDPATEWNEVRTRVRIAVFKYTNCGAWVNFRDAPNITLGSTVEGSDVDCTPITLSWPFVKQDWWNALSEIEGEADFIWHEWNEEEDSE